MRIELSATKIEAPSETYCLQFVGENAAALRCLMAYCEKKHLLPPDAEPTLSAQEILSECRYLKNFVERMACDAQLRPADRELIANLLANRSRKLKRLLRRM